MLVACFLAAGCQSASQQTGNTLFSRRSAERAVSETNYDANVRNRFSTRSRAADEARASELKTIANSDLAEPTIGQVGFQEPGEKQTAAINKAGLIAIDEPASQPSFETPLQEEEAPGGIISTPNNSTDGLAPNVVPSTSPGVSEQTGTLTLEQVINSVVDSFPSIEEAIGRIDSANGKVLASWGDFDQILSAHSISQPLGFYQTYRNGTGLTQPLFQGGEVYGTYRIGDGNFEPWYGERETNEAGELKAGFSLPLLKNRDIDQRRAKLFQSGFQREQTVANVETTLLLIQRAASQAYWDWVAAGQVVQIQTRLLELAEARVNQIKGRIEEEDLAEIAQIDNDRFIAKRRNTIRKARRTLEKAAIKLSMFYRDANENPIIASENQLPPMFPASTALSLEQLQAGITQALARRPELTELNALRKEVCIDLRYAQNLLLPKVDFKGFAGQDLGGATSSKGDKTPFELQLGVLAEVPLQRRQGLGKIQEAEGKLTQLDAKIQLTSDKIRAEVQDAASAVNAAFDQIRISQQNVDLTRRSLEAGKVLFEEGDINLIELNIRETSVAEAELELLDAQFKYFFYISIYETAIRGTAFE